MQARGGGVEGGENLSGLPALGHRFTRLTLFYDPTKCRSLAEHPRITQTHTYVSLVCMYTHMRARARARARARVYEEHRVFVRVQAYKHVILSPRQLHYSELYNNDAASRLIRFGREL